MRTLLITKEYPPFKGGVANYYYNLAKNFHMGNDFLVFDNKDKKLDSDKGFFSWRRSFKSVYDKIKKEEISHVLVGQVLPLGTVVFCLSFVLPIKYTVFFHGLDLSLALKPGRKKFLTKLIIKRAYKLVAANSFVAHTLTDNFPQKKDVIKVVNPGISLADYNLDFNKQELREKYQTKDKIVLFSLGRLVKRKGFDYTIKALEKMSEAQINNLVYFIAGAGEEREYLESLVPQRLKNVIIFLGEVREKEKKELLFLCDIFIMPARDIAGDYEGFGIVYLEANIFSKPVIAGLSGGVGDAVINNKTGLLINPEDIMAIKDSILVLKNDKNLRLKLGQQGRDRVMQEFSWKKLAKDLFYFIK